MTGPGEAGGPERRPPLSPWGILSAAATLTALASLVAFAERLWWPLFFAVHFRLQYAVCLGAAALLFVLGRRWRQAGLFGAVALLNGVLVAPAWFGPGSSAAAEERPALELRLLVSNVLTRNRAHGAVRRLIEAEDADVVVLQEVSLEWWRALEPVFERYPYRECEPRGDNFGIAMLSKLPFEGVEVRWFSSAKPPSIVAEFATSAGPLHLVATHPLSPQGRRPKELCEEQLREVAAFAAQLEGHVIVAGDLNTTPWTEAFEELLESSGLRDSRRGFGNQATWPTFLWPAMLPLDHVLVSEGVEVVERRLGPEVGSDHLPLIVELRAR